MRRPSPTGRIHLGERVFPLASGSFSLVLRGRAPDVRTFLDFEVRGIEDDDGWLPVLTSASWLPVPDHPSYRPGADAAYDIPLLDAAGSTVNLQLYVFEHAAVRDARLSLAGLTPGRVALSLVGRSDLGWGGTDPGFGVVVQAELDLDYVSALDAVDERSGREILAAADLPDTFVAEPSHWGWRFTPVGRPE